MNSIHAPNLAASFICASQRYLAGEVEGVGGDHVLHALAFRFAEDHQDIFLSGLSCEVPAVAQNATFRRGKSVFGRAASFISGEPQLHGRGYTAPLRPSSVRREKPAATAWALSKRTLYPGFLDDGSPMLDFLSHLRAKFSRRLNLRLDTLKAQPVARVGVSPPPRAPGC
jgi:hypothetical protein